MFRPAASDWTSAAEPPPLPQEPPCNHEAWCTEKPLLCGITSAGALMRDAMSDQIAPA
jgi:hypothetical protein